MAVGKPFRSHFHRAFLAAVAALGIGVGGVTLDNLPKNPQTGTQTVSTFETASGLTGYNVSPSDQYWKHTLGMKTSQQKSDELLSAAENSDSWRAQALFEHGASPKSEAAVQALSIASLEGDNEVVNVLLKNGVDPTANDGQALISAARGHHGVLALRYLDLGVPADAQNSAALVYAAAGADDNLVRALLDRGVAADARQGAALNSAALFGNSEIVSTLLSAGADARANDSAALRTAAGRGDVLVMQQLVSAGADAAAHNSDALTLAADNGNGDAVRFLLRQPGVDVSTGDNLPLQIAVIDGHLDAVSALIDKGAPVNLKDGLPLSFAVLGGDRAMAQLLIDKGADVNAGNGAALYTAVVLGDANMAQLLMQNNANPGLGKIRQAATDPAVLKILQGGGGAPNTLPRLGGPLF